MRSSLSLDRNPARGRGRSRSSLSRPARLFGMFLEPLEPRCLLTSSATATAAATASTVIAPASITINATSAGTPSGMTPSQVRAAYGFSTLFSGSTSAYNASAGAGTTIAIVTAYDDPNILNDVNMFSQQYGLPALNSSSTSPTLTRAIENGTMSDYWQGGGWALETALDVESAHAIAPAANILVVEARSPSLNDLLSAVNYARSYTGVVAVSMSWGGSDFTGQSSYDNTFTTPSGHAGVTFVAASGDNGSGAQWPASVPTVIGVGGTTLPSNGSAETAWSGSGGGYSVANPLTSFETSYASATGNSALSGTATMRGVPDVAYDANPSTGFAVYDSMPYGYSYAPGWVQVGGTSAGTPQWAGLVAVADGLRLSSGSSSLNGGTQVLPALYSLASNSTTYASNFNDITSGSNGQYHAGPGYDLVTGLGSPRAGNLILTLTGVSGTGSSLTFHTATIGLQNSSVTRSDVIFPIGGTTSTTTTTTTTTPTSPTPAPVTEIILVINEPGTHVSEVFVILVGNTSQPFGATSGGTSASTSTTGSSSSAVGSSVSILTASSSGATTGPVRPPQSLLQQRGVSDLERSLLLHGVGEPIETPEPASPLEDQELLGGRAGDDGLNLLAIGRRAAALGRVDAWLDGLIGRDRDLDLEFELDPRNGLAPVDLDTRARDSEPILDPVLAGVVITLGTALAARPEASRRDRRNRLASRLGVLPWT